MLMFLRAYIFEVINDGCTNRPVNTSVTAKQASRMLALVWSLGLLFTAIITNTLSRTVNGQVMLFIIMVTIKLISSWTFRVLSSIIAFDSLLVVFVRFDPKWLAMLD